MKLTPIREDTTHGSPSPAALLAGGFNRTPVEARALTDRLRAAIEVRGVVHQQYVTLEADAVLDLLGMAEALIQMAEDTVHVVVVDAVTVTFAMQHPPNERGDLLGCPLFEAVSQYLGQGAVPSGRYLVED